jgi:hypothetical protein
VSMGRSSFRDSLKVLEADIQHANSLWVVSSPHLMPRLFFLNFDLGLVLLSWDWEIINSYLSACSAVPVPKCVLSLGLLWACWYLLITENCCAFLLEQNCCVNWVEYGLDHEMQTGHFGSLVPVIIGRLDWMWCVVDCDTWNEIPFSECFDFDALGTYTTLAMVGYN